MKSLVTMRQEILSSIKTLLTTSFSTVKVAYPNLFNIDLENFSDPYFIKVELELGSDIVAGDTGKTDISIYGSLIVHAIFKFGTGAAGSTALTDALVSTFVGENYGAINYTTMKTYITSPYPGYSGTKHVIKFIAA